MEQINSGQRSLHVVEEAGLYDDDGAIYDLRTRRAFVETLDYWETPPNRHPALGLPRVKPARDLDGLNLFLGGLGGQTFYHFLIDNLPKLALLQTLYPEASRIIVQSHFENNKVAWLRHAGCKLPIEWLSPLDHLRCERLAFTSRVTTLYRATPWSLARLRELVDCTTPPQTPPKRFIWADRRSANIRNTPWETEIIAALPPPWETVNFDHLEPAKVVEIMASCAAFAGFHGAAFANLALAPSGTQVLEVFRVPNHAWYPSLSILRGHNHQVLFTESPSQIPAILSRLASMV